MKQDEKRIMRVLYVIGIIPIIWIALLLAPYTKGGLIEIIKNAGEVMLSAHNIESDSIGSKEGSANFVTVYDVKIQELIISEIKKLVPDALFIAEEKENDAAVLMGEHCFIIDPIDGTTNFIHDYRHSCISLAMFSRGEAVFGAVYDPYQKDGL